MKYRFIKFCSVWLALLICSYAINTQAKTTDPKTTKPTVYFVNGAEVNETTFDVFRKSIQEIKNTNHCKKTRFGGTTIYEAIDSAGVRYEVRLEDGEKVNRAIIKKIE